MSVNHTYIRYLLFLGCFTIAMVIAIFALTKAIASIGTSLGRGVYESVKRLWQMANKANHQLLA